MVVAVAVANTKLHRHILNARGASDVSTRDVAVTGRPSHKPGLGFESKKWGFREP